MVNKTRFLELRLIMAFVAIAEKLELKLPFSVGPSSTLFHVISRVLFEKKADDKLLSVQLLEGPRILISAPEEYGLSGMFEEVAEWFSPEQDEQAVAVAASKQNGKDQLDCQLTEVGQAIALCEGGKQARQGFSAHGFADRFRGL